MLNVKRISGKKILVVVAHPDDETLWFYNGIKTLKMQNTLNILCLTYSEDNPRGQELMNVGKQIGVDIYFGLCADKGLSRLLCGIQEAMERITLVNSYDVIITHPPHGGEKPHPHHIQSFLGLKNYCKANKIVFAFFSEMKIELNTSSRKITCSSKKLLIQKMIASFFLLKDELLYRRMLFLLDCFFSVLFLRRSFYFIEIVDGSSQDREEILNLFKSQIEVLKKYQSYEKGREYLYYTK